MPQVEELIQQEVVVEVLEVLEEVEAEVLQMVEKEMMEQQVRGSLSLEMLLQKLVSAQKGSKALRALVIEMLVVVGLALERELEFEGRVVWACFLRESALMIEEMETRKKIEKELEEVEREMGSD